MSHSIRISLAPLALLALVACGGAPPPSADADPAPVAVRIAVAERSSGAERTELTGTVEADRTAAVSTRVMAMVTAVHVGLGDRVAAGQALVSIDPTASEGQLAQALGARTQARAALDLAERNFERYRALAETGAASELELDLARTQHEQARGAVEQAEGAVAAARSVAGDSRVTAPFAGRVARRHVEVGDLAAPGRPLVELESERGRRLTLAVPESLMSESEIALGDRVPVRLDARRREEPIEGEVVEVSPGPDPTTHSYTVKLALRDADLPAGAAARALLPSRAREVVTVPAEAIVESGGLTLVVVRDDEGRARSRVVTLGSDLGRGRVEILSGLAGGESVALGLSRAPASGTPLQPSGDAGPAVEP